MFSEPTSRRSPIICNGLDKDSQRESFLQELQTWVTESPYDERQSRENFSRALKEAFNTQTSSFRFSGGIRSLPACIGRLTTLQELNLSDCRDLLSLPAEIRGLCSLHTLNLQSCPALFSLPVEIGLLRNLKTLNLSSCISLVSVPPEIGNLDSLRTLKLHYTGLTSIPPEIGNLHSLEDLYLGATKVNFLPPEIGNLRSLKGLHLSFSHNLNELPSAIGGLLSLEVLVFGGCTKLTFIPSEIGDLRNLKILYLKGCPNITFLPAEIGLLESLQSLDLTDCKHLTSLPLEMGNLQSLNSIYISGCKSLRSLPLEKISLENLDSWRAHTFIQTLQKFLALFLRLKANYVHHESLNYQTKGLDATGRFVNAFKKRIIEKPLKDMEKERFLIDRAIDSLMEHCGDDEIANRGEYGLALPLIILKCFLAEDARVHCLRLEQELIDHFLLEDY